MVSEDNSSFQLTHGQLARHMTPLLSLYLRKT